MAEKSPEEKAAALKAVLEGLAEQQERNAQLSEANAEASREHHDALLKEANLLERKLVAETKAHKQREIALDLKKKELDILVRRSEALKKASELTSDQEKELGGLGETIKKLASEVAKETKELKLSTATLTKMTKETAAANTASSNFRQGIGSLTTSIVGYRGGLGKAMSTTAGFKGAMHGLVTAIGSAFTISGVIDLFASFANVMVQATLDIDNQRLALVQATGASTDLQEAMYELRAETMGLNVSGQEMAQGLMALRAGMRDFDKLTRESKASMASMSTQLDKLGMAFDDQTRIMQFMNVTMGQTMTEAQQTVKELYSMTAAAGKGPKELAADFQAAMPMLSVYGKKMRHEFAMMAAASRETGIEMSKLMGIVGTMDTFEGAADLAGTMNAFLGGPYLNTVELVSMTEQERLIAIKRSMVASGRSFKQMSRYQQKGIAKSLNMDLAEANALFSSSERAIRGRSRAMEIAAKREMDYKKKIKESLPVMQALQVGFKEVGMSFMGALLGVGPNAGPAAMVEALSGKVQDLKVWVTESLVPALQSLSRGFGKVQIVLAAVGAALAHVGSVMVFWGKLLSPVMAALGVFAKILGVVFNTLFGIWNIMKGIANLMVGNFGKGLAQLGGGALQVGGGVVAATGVGAGVGIGVSVLGSAIATGVDDFIYRGDGSAKGATIQPINKNDSFVGVKPGGGMDHNMSAMLAELRKLNRAQSENSAALRELAEKTGKMQINMDSRKVGEAVSSTVIRKINRRGT
jgi:hypothetical protein